MARRLGGTLAAVAAICAIGPSVPSADAETTVSSVEDTRFGGFYITVLGDDTANDFVVTFRRRDRAFVITDSEPIEIDTSFYGARDCDRLTSLAVSCESPRNTSVIVRGEGGDDEAEIGRRFPTGTYLDGGPGNDAFVGGRHGDYFPAGPGDDVLRGRRGPDGFDEGYIRGFGSDSFLGGRGADELFADDGSADQRIDCGRGRRDRALIDSMLDPRPIGCETVREG